MPFVTIGDTRLQAFQYKLINRIIPCNKCLFDIKIKDNPQCNYCCAEDNIQHFFLFCNNTYQFLKLNWCKM